jgi:hypothetical protein
MTTEDIGVRAPIENETSSSEPTPGVKSAKTRAERLIALTELDDDTRAFVGCLAGHMKRDDSGLFGCWPSIRHLAERMKISQARVRQAKARAKVAGIIAEQYPESITRGGEPVELFARTGQTLPYYTLVDAPAAFLAGRDRTRLTSTAPARVRLSERPEAFDDLDIPHARGRVTESQAAVIIELADRYALAISDDERQALRAEACGIVPAPDRRAAILERIEAEPAGISTKALRKATGWRFEHVKNALAQLEGDGRIARNGHRWTSTALPSSIEGERTHKRDLPSPSEGVTNPNNEQVVTNPNNKSPHGAQHGVAPSGVSLAAADRPSPYRSELTNAPNSLVGSASLHQRDTHDACVHVGEHVSAPARSARAGVDREADTEPVLRVRYPLAERAAQSLRFAGVDPADVKLTNDRLPDRTTQQARARATADRRAAS